MIARAISFEWSKAAKTAALSVGGAVLFMVIGIPAAPILGAMTAVAAASIAGARGSRFSVLRLRDIVSLIPVSLAVTAMTGIIGVSAGAAVGYFIGVGPLPGLLAFAPGSMEMMISIALTLNQQPAYVAAHHITRTLLLLSVVPLFVRWLPRLRTD